MAWSKAWKNPKMYIYIYVYIHSHVFRVEHQNQEDQGPYHDNITVSIKHVVSKEPWYVSSFSGLVAASMNQGIATRVQQSIMYQFVHILKEKITPTQLGPSLARWVLVSSGLGDTYSEAVGILCQLLSGKTAQEGYASEICNMNRNDVLLSSLLPGVLSLNC